MNTARPPNRTSAAIAQHMAEQGVTIRDLSTRVRITYEHARRIVRGEAIPSTELATRISHVLSMNPDQLLLLGKADRMKEKFDVEILSVPDSDDVETLKGIWTILSTERRRDLIEIAKLFAGLNSLDEKENKEQ